MFPSERQAINHLVAKTIMGENIDRQGFKLSNLIDDDYIESLGSKVKSKLLSWIFVIGQAGTGLYITFVSLRWIFHTVINCFSISREEGNT